jgi:hypothetical protein
MTEHNNRATPDGDEERDDLLLSQVRDVLTPMPVVNRQAIANILTAVAARRPSRWARLRNVVTFTADQWWYATSPLARGSAIAAIALTLGFVGRGFIMRDATTGTASDRTTIARAAAPTPSTLQAVEGAADRSTLRVPVQLVLDAREAGDATSLSVVGDFNDWDMHATPMTLDGGVWSVTLTLSPGRHVYAFVVNGSRWRADPRAPRAADSDFGRPGSVLFVQTP